MKKTLCILLTISLLTLSLAGCGGAKTDSTGTTSNEPKAEKITLVAAHVAPTSHHYQDGFNKMNEILQAKTNGQISIVTHPNSELGEEPEYVEGLQTATIDLSTISAAPMTAFVKEYMACDLPFMFASPEEAYAFYDGPVGDELLKLAEPIGLIGLAWWENGFRNFTNNVRPITSPADMKGMKIRTMASPVHMTSVNALGANATPIPFGELYSALQQGVVDGEENPVALIYSNRFYEVQKYLTLSRHFYDPSPLYISKITWDKLTDEQKKIVKDAAIEARDYSRKLANDRENDSIEEMKAAGLHVTILTPEQIKAFQEATKDVYKEYVDKIGKDFLDRFLKGAGR
ncbi:MAG TPA: DctP family TRAP transporter solute-binding subunit [Bacillota bacterium]|nr:DctP family TRAP transporter solute-binding subunit [Bacillota bacterium]